MHFSLKFSDKRNLGFLIFQLFLTIFVLWVFVLRCYKHDSHALIWLIWWFWEQLEILGFGILRKLGILFNWT